MPLPAVAITTVNGQAQLRKNKVTPTFLDSAGPYRHVRVRGSLHLAPSGYQTITNTSKTAHQLWSNSLPWLFLRPLFVLPAPTHAQDREILQFLCQCWTRKPPAKLIWSWKVKSSTSSASRSSNIQILGKDSRGSGIDSGAKAATYFNAILMPLQLLHTASHCPNRPLQWFADLPICKKLRIKHSHRFLDPAGYKLNATTAKADHSIIPGGAPTQHISASCPSPRVELRAAPCRHHAHGRNAPRAAPCCHWTQPSLSFIWC